MSIKVLVNPESGAVNTHGVSWIKERVKTELNSAGYSADFIYGNAEDLQLHAGALVNKASPELLICIGGDGTIAAVAQSLIGTNVPLLPLPGGTMNMFVQDLDISNDLGVAIAGAIHGQQKTIDVGMIDDRVFINNVVFGAYTEIADAREGLGQSDTAAQTLKAVSTVADAVFSAEPKSYSLSGPSINTKFRSNVLMVTNNSYTGADLLRPIRRRINQGKLGLYIADSLTGPDLVMHMAEILAGRLKESDDVRIFDVKECEISSDTQINVAVDGEPADTDGPVKVRSVPRAISVICPPVSGG